MQTEGPIMRETIAEALKTAMKAQDKRPPCDAAHDPVGDQGPRHRQSRHRQGRCQRRGNAADPGQDGEAARGIGEGIRAGRPAGACRAGARRNRHHPRLPAASSLATTRSWRRRARRWPRPAPAGRRTWAASWPCSRSGSPDKMDFGKASGIVKSLAAIARCPRAFHEFHDLHRRSPAGGPPPDPARLLRLSRSRLLWRGDAARQPCRPAAGQASPARAGRRVRTRHRLDDARREGLVADRAVDHRHGRPDAWQRRDPGLPRGAGGRHSLYAQHHVDLLDRGRGGCGRQAVLVPALCHEGSRLRALADRARHRGQVQRAGGDSRSAGARPAPQRRPQRPQRAAVAEIRATSSTWRPSRAGSTAS